MKLFMREHLPLIILHVVQLFLVLLVYWLDGYRNLHTGLYSIFLGIIALSAYLFYRYTTHQSLYKKLSAPMEALEDSIQGGGSAPLTVALDELLLSQYGHFQQQMQIRERTRTDHLAFMNQWVIR